MKKYNWIVGILIVLLVILCIDLWGQKNAEYTRMETLCINSAEAAMENFQRYNASGENSDYMSGVAEFRSFMTAYLFLNDNHTDGEYIWCNNVYGYMVQKPEKVQENLHGLIDALEYLSEDYDSPNGFNLINVYSNELTYGEEIRDINHL